MNQTTPPTPITLESIVQQKEELLQQIQQQKGVMSKLSQEIFAPLAPSANKTGSIMQAFNTGMAIFDGAMMGLKLIRKFRALLGKSRR